MKINGVELKEGDWISLNGTTEAMYKSKVATQDAQLGEDFNELMKITDKYRRMDVRTNADTQDALLRIFGATGIVSCATQSICSSKMTRF